MNDAGNPQEPTEERQWPGKRAGRPDPNQPPSQPDSDEHRDIQVREATIIWRDGQREIDLSLGLSDIEACEMLADAAAELAHRIAIRVMHPDIIGVKVMSRDEIERAYPGAQKQPS